MFPKDLAAFQFSLKLVKNQIHREGMKLIKTKEKINPFGGVNFILDSLYQYRIPELIDQKVGKRPHQARYKYSDLLLNLWSIFFCGGDCAEDLQEHLKPHFERVPYLKPSSPDALLRGVQSLKSSNIQYTATGKSHVFNQNRLLACLNLDILKKLGLLKENKGYTLDYDNVIVEAEKKDARYTYRNEKGYVPGVATIDDCIVYLENRNGNSDAQTYQSDTLIRMFDLLNQKQIRIENFRADSASYQFGVIQQVREHCRHFYIRSRSTANVLQNMAHIKNWKPLTYNNQPLEIGSTHFIPFQRSRWKPKADQLQTYRLVVIREPKADGQTNIYTKQAYFYRGILTNDFDSSDEEIFQFYNKRGGQEREFDVMHNDFGWKNLPFSYLNENTVFMTLMAMCRNLYTFLIRRFSKVVPYLRPTYRLKKFIFRFVIVASKWIRTSRMDKLKLYASKRYPPSG